MAMTMMWFCFSCDETVAQRTLWNREALWNVKLKTLSRPQAPRLRSKDPKETKGAKHKTKIKTNKDTRTIQPKLQQTHRQTRPGYGWQMWKNGPNGWNRRNRSNWREIPTDLGPEPKKINPGAIPNSLKALLCIQSIIHIQACNGAAQW